MSINVNDSPSSTRTQSRETQEAQVRVPTWSPKTEDKAQTPATPPATPAQEAKPDVAKEIVDGARKAVKGAEDAIKQKLQKLLGGDDDLGGRQFAQGTGKKGTRGGIRTVMNSPTNNGPTNSGGGPITA